MPEDTSDDSSIPDCCRSEPVAIRNLIFLHAALSKNKPLHFRASVLPAVSGSCSLKELHDRSAIRAEMHARLFSVKETGLRDKILLFFDVFRTVSRRIFAKVLRGWLTGVLPSERYDFANKHLRLSGFTDYSGAELKRFFVAGFGAEPVLARVSGNNVTRTRTPQQKF